MAKNRAPESQIDEIRIVPGKTHFLISASHSHLHKRPSMSGSYRQAEEKTESIGRDLSLKTKAHFITVAKELEYDPNYHKEESNPYKRLVAQTVKDSNIRYFIDLHGMEEGKMHDLYIYYPYRYIKSSKFAKSLSSFIKESRMRDLNVLILNHSGRGESLCEYNVQNFGVAAIQIEIAKYIRDDEQIRNGLVDVMSEFMLSTN